METLTHPKIFLLQYLENYLIQFGCSQTLSDVITFVIACGILALLAWLLKRWGTRLLSTVIHLTVKRTKTLWDDFLLQRKFFSRLILMIVGGVLLGTARIIFAGYAPAIIDILQLILRIYLVVMSALLIGSFMDALHDIYNTKPAAKRKSIKSIIQAIMIVVYVVAGIIVVAIIIRKDPTQLLVGLGASAAILTLVFKDTILGFVASIQISAQDMIRPGDWIEMPSKGADGVVTEINVNSVKVENWNKTVTMIPIYSLVSESFTNWRHMEEGSGRRFKRPLLIDIHSIHPLDAAQIEALKRHPWIAPVAENMSAISDRTNTSPFVNNLGLFRCYVAAYLQAHRQVAQHMPLIVRYLNPDENGIPLELYGFSTEKSFAPFEEVVSDIFNHLLSVAPLFGLRLYQRPTNSTVPTDPAFHASSPEEHAL